MFNNIENVVQEIDNCTDIEELRSVARQATVFMVLHMGYVLDEVNKIQEDSGYSQETKVTVKHVSDRARQRIQADVIKLMLGLPPEPGM